MQDLLPIAVRVARDSDIVDLMCALAALFNKLCSKELSIEKLDDIGASVVITLCKMEKMFPPSFFTIIVHLLVHLTEKAKLGGPVFYRWMYPIERLEYIFFCY